MTTTPTPSDHDTFVPTLAIADLMPVVEAELRAERDAAREELAKTRTELDAMTAVAKSNKRVTQNMAQELIKALSLLADYVDGEYPHARAKRLLAENLDINAATTAEPADEPNRAACIADDPDHAGMTCDQYDAALDAEGADELKDPVVKAAHDLVAAIRSADEDADWDDEPFASLMHALVKAVGEPADEPKAEPAATVHGYTAHGHPCCGEATVGSRPASRARCGGTHLCRDCQAAAGRIHGEEPAAG